MTAPTRNLYLWGGGGEGVNYMQLVQLLEVKHSFVLPGKWVDVQVERKYFPHPVLSTSSLEEDVPYQLRCQSNYIHQELGHWGLPGEIMLSCYQDAHSKEKKRTNNQKNCAF